MLFENQIPICVIYELSRTIFQEVRARCKDVEGIDHRVVDDAIYIRMVEDINDISKSLFIKRIWSIVWNSFTYRQEWVFKF
jgi:hypothetical protein